MQLRNYGKEFILGKHNVFLSLAHGHMTDIFLGVPTDMSYLPRLKGSCGFAHQPRELYKLYAKK